MDYTLKSSEYETCFIYLIVYLNLFNCYVWYARTHSLKCRLLSDTISIIYLKLKSKILEIWFLVFKKVLYRFFKNIGEQKFDQNYKNWPCSPILISNQTMKTLRDMNTVQKNTKTLSTKKCTNTLHNST